MEVVDRVTCFTWNSLQLCSRRSQFYNSFTTYMWACNGYRNP